jgi:aryl-alcohol dehydrogenase-like predicted oxidoreductase
VVGEAKNMKYRTLGRTGFEVSEIGFGAWAIGGDRWGRQTDEDSLAALHAAIDRGVNLIDTAASYGEGHSERLIGRIMRERKEHLIVCTKTPPEPRQPWPPSPYCKALERYTEKYLRNNVEERRKNLGVDCIDVLLLHTWTRAWNAAPYPLEVLQKLKAEGLIRSVGISTPEHDQNSVIDPMRDGLIDVVEIIYNLFEQEPAAQLLPEAKKHNVGVVVRVVFDEGALTGKYSASTRFEDGDFRNNYFAGDRLERTVRRVEEIKKDLEGTGFTLPQAAVKFALAQDAVGTVIPGMRTISQVEQNTAVSSMGDLPKDLLVLLRRHNWRKSFWIAGK